MFGSSPSLELRDMKTKLLIGLFALVMAVACGTVKPHLGQKESAKKSDPYPLFLTKHDPEVEAYYRDNADFFQIKAPEDVPANLKWEDGNDLEPFSSPEAKQGGTLNYFMSDFPRTLRFVGPEANGAFRGYMLDDNAIGLVHRHPNADFDFYPGLAKSWAVSKDGKTAYYKLDPDACYSDGEPVKVKDFFFTFFFLRSRHINAPWYNDYYGNWKFTRIAIYDERTISISYYKAKPD